VRGAVQYAAGANRAVAQAVSKGGAGWAVALGILFWLIFYQNLPWSLDGFSSGVKGPTQTANIGDRIIKVGMIAMSLYAIATHWPLARALTKNINVGFAALMILAPLSALWSIDSTATLLRYTSLVAIVLTCFAISLAGWQPQRFMQLALTPLMLILLASLACGVLYPDRIAEIGTDISQRNAWHGVTHGKNEFGMMSSMSLIMCANLWLAREGRTTLWAMAGTAVSFLCLILSRSNTSLLASVVAVISMVLVMRVPVIRQRYSTPVVVAIASLILLYELVIQNVIPGVNTLMGPILSLVGKDVTFSARSIIWGVIKEHIQGAPWLGSGYGAYWTGPFETSPSYVFIPLMFFYPTEAHNGYLDVINDMGMAGLICLLAFLYWFLRQGIQLLRLDRPRAALYLALLFQEMIIDMSESEWLSRTSTFAILLLATTCLSRGLLDARARAQPVRAARR
jgi:exopolysaccharide production protein ExoQ